MSNILVLNQNQVFQGLGTLTFTVPATIVNGPSVSNVPFTVLTQVTVPSSLPTGAGSGSGVDQGLGATGGFQGIGQGSNLSTGNGGKGLGFGGTANDNATGNGNGHGAGAGGGDVTNFARGGNGTSDGGVGQGFGPVPNNYNQPIADVIVPTSGAAQSSSLVITVKQNGSIVFTAPSITPTQIAQQFKTTLLCTAADVITVVFSSSNANDETLNCIVSNTSIYNGA